MKTYNKSKKILSVLFVLCMSTVVMSTSIALASDTDMNTDTGAYTYTQDTVIYDGDSLPDNGELFREYARREFEKGIYGESENLPAMYGVAARENLPAGKPQRAIYEKLRLGIEKIAAGQLASSRFTLTSLFNESCCDEEDLGMPITCLDANNVPYLSPEAKAAYEEKIKSWIRQAYRALLEDCPYDFYWWDKTIGLSYSYTSRRDFVDNKAVIGLAGLKINFVVAQEYRGNSEFTLDTAKTSATTTAIANAKAVVDNNASKGDLEKLDAYRQYICDAVSYNHAAAGAVSMVYGNPWQLIWVFDDNPDTNVVCEGYSKAFQYLCDLSQFQNEVTCYSLWGKAEILGGSSEGHMWNAVNYKGENYLVDLTNCDEGTIGAPKKLYMAPAIYVPLETGETEGPEGTEVTEVTYNKTEEPSFYALIDLENEIIMSYTYDEDQKDFIVSGYLPMSNYPIFTVPTGLTATYGDTLSDISLPEVTGLETPGIWQWAEPDRSVGDASEASEFSALFVPTGETLFDIVQDVKISVKVNPKTITDVDVGNIAPQEYSGSKIMPEIVVTGDAGNTLVKDHDYIVEYGENIGPGTNEGTVTVKAKEGGNYTFSDIVAQFDIGKADWTDTAVAAKAKYGTGGSVDLSEYIAEGGNLGTPGKTDNDGILSGTPVLEGSVLRFTMADDIANIGKTAVITVPVRDSNVYEDYTITVTLTAMEKEPQDVVFMIDHKTVTYGDDGFSYVAAVPYDGGEVTYSSDNTDVAAVDPNTGEVTILKAGTATITAEATSTDKYEAGKAEYTITVNKKTLTITAENKKVYIGADMPVLTYKTEGLVNGDIVRTEPAIEISGGAPDMSKAGTYTITVSNAQLSNQDSYEITYVNGTLTVSQKPASGGGGGGGAYVPPSTTENKQSDSDEPAEQLKTKEEAEIEAVKNFNPKAKSKVVRLKNGKKAVLLTWDKGNVGLDGVEIYRSTKKNSGYGKKPIFTTKKETYCNSTVKKGKTYYYKLRGFVVIEGRKYYTGFSNKAYRTVK